MICGLPAHLRSVLRDVMQRHLPDLVSVFDSPEPEELTIQERINLRDAVGSELCETGFESDFEPNERGRSLEELIDWLGVALGL
jgi:hypothetical protein